MSNSKDGQSGEVVKSSDLDSFFLQEKFPENWYPIEKPYSFLNVLVNTLEILAPRFVLPGQNAGAGNYLPLQPSLDLKDLTPQNLVSYLTLLLATVTL